MTREKRVGAIILAGGRSERLGRAKQLLPWNSRTLVEAVVEEVCRAGRLAVVAVVLRPEVAEALGKRAGERLGCARIVFPDETGEGCAASYRSGLAALEESELDAVVILLGDQPGMRAETIERVIAGWERSAAAIAVARYRDGEGHPLVFDRSLFAELRGLRGEKAAWKLVDRYRERVYVVEIEESMPGDIDTWEDYEARRQRGA
ncbi:nucleotidyltransferase family protein [Thermomicrobium sp.]